MDLRNYLKRIAPYLEKDENGILIMPDPEEDFERYMYLHSWYKL